jgi:hypothetical protein
MAEHWIAGSIHHPGALHKELGIPIGKTIPVKTLHRAEQKGGKLAKRANEAETLRKLNHKKGK